MAKKNTHKHGGHDSSGGFSQHEGHEIHEGHQGGDHHAHMATDFLKRFWISLVITHE
jgi:P-type Cu2+ transporter